MLRSVVSRASWGLLLGGAAVLGGCHVEAVDPAGQGSGEWLVFVGEASEAMGATAENAATEHVLVAAALEDGVMRFFACGDAELGTLTAWFELTVDGGGAEVPVQSTAVGGWQLDAVLTDGRLSGRLMRSDQGVRSFVAEAAPDTHNEHVFFSDGGDCETGLIVPLEGEPHGSYCTPPGAPGIMPEMDPRAQVTPLRPSSHGHLVKRELVDGESIELPSVTLQNR